MRCSNQKKSNCNEPCIWVNGKGCRKNAPPKKESLQLIPWGMESSIDISDLENCIGKFSIKNQEADAISSIGFYFDIVHKGKKCILKLAPLSAQKRTNMDFLEPMSKFVKKEHFDLDLNISQKLAKLNLGPDIYNAGLCTVKFYDHNDLSKSPKIVECGYMISDGSFSQKVKNCIDDIIVHAILKKKY